MSNRWTVDSREWVPKMLGNEDIRSGVTELTVPDEAGTIHTGRTPEVLGGRASSGRTGNIPDARLPAANDGARCEFELECLKWRKRILTGKHAHFCHDWDGLPVDETCEEFSSCHCVAPECGKMSEVCRYCGHIRVNCLCGKGGFKGYSVQAGEWVQPITEGYRMLCCDCGLAHLMDFRVHEGRIQFRAYRSSDGGRR